MKRMKKIMAVITIMAFVFGGFLPVATADEGQEVSAKSEAAVVSAPAAEESGVAATPMGDITSCAVPTMIYLNDGLGNVDVDYFNTKDEISANWDFDDKGCPITEYKYRVVKFAGPTPWQVITDDWIPTTNKFATVDLVSLALPSLIEGEKYGIKVIAKNSEGPSEKYKTDGQTLDLTPPTMNYFALQQDRPYGGGINLQFSANDLNEIKNFQIYRSGLLYDTVSGATNTYADVISGDNVEFTYYIQAVDVAGNISESSNLQSAVVDDVAPGAPSISYWIGGKNIVIFFPAVSGASSYEIYRSGALIYSGPDVKYTDTNTVRGETYSYTVYALDEAGNKSPASNTLEIYIPKPKVSSVATAGEVQGTSTVTPEKTEQVSPSPSPTPSGQVEGTESPKPEETQEEGKTNWSLIIAIIIAAAIVVAGVLYWWYAREDEDDEI